ncbi:hypothetical protein [Longimicrobium sp.]|nr:hypothetical protein [Longimicrobium sp.]HEX6040184.1 hypothetical protein [Longimicrobium sp.]
MALKLSDLEVTSFTTSTIADKTLPTIDNPNEPTPATFCYHCPGYTSDCV